jgi:hypothetical protein
MNPVSAFLSSSPYRRLTHTAIRFFACKWCQDAASEAIVTKRFLQEIIPAVSLVVRQERQVHRASVCRSGSLMDTAVENALAAARRGTGRLGILLDHDHVQPPRPMGAEDQRLLDVGRTRRTGNHIDRAWQDSGAKGVA